MSLRSTLPEPRPGEVWATSYGDEWVLLTKRESRSMWFGVVLAGPAYVGEGFFYSRKELIAMAGEHH